MGMIQRSGGGACPGAAAQVLHGGGGGRGQPARRHRAQAIITTTTTAFPRAAAPVTAVILAAAMIVLCPADAAATIAAAPMGHAVAHGPSVSVPPALTVEATGPLTALTLGQLGPGTVLLPVGNNTIVWSITSDATGAAANATQTVTVRDTVSPVLTVPARIHVDAAGVLTWVDLSAAASAADAVDPSPDIEHNATSDYLPLGDTPVRWTAADASGNTAHADAVVRVSPVAEGGGTALDADWHYKSSDNYAVIPTKGLEKIKLQHKSSTAHSMSFFKSFPLSEVENSTISVSAGGSLGPGVSVSVLDGAYSTSAGSDFARALPVLKGAGVLALQRYDQLGTAIVPGWNASQLDHVTLVVSLGGGARGNYHVNIDSIEISNHSRWVFDHYQVEQNNLHGKFAFRPLPPEGHVVHPLPVNDTFDGPHLLVTSPSQAAPPVVDGWTYWGTTVRHTEGRDAATGNPAPSLHVRTDGFAVEAGMSKVVDTSATRDGGQRLVFSYDYRSTSTAGWGGITNTIIRIFDPGDPGRVLFSHTPARSNAHDTGWQSYTRDITDAVSGVDAARIVLYLRDFQGADYRQQNWFDNVRVYTVNQTSPVPAAGTLAPPTAGAAGASGGEGAPAPGNGTLGAFP